MTILDHRPDANTVSHEAVATIAQQRAGSLFTDLILRDAKINEQELYIDALEARVRELEQQTEPVTAPAGPRAGRPRHEEPGEPEPA